jgi:Mg-chelatase subunit ChlD
MVRLGQTNLASPEAGFAQLSSAAPVSFAASEQAVIQHNQAVARPVAVAVYPNGAVPALDFPVVTVRRAGDAPAITAAAADFQRALRAIEGQRILAAAGFRDPAADPISGAQAGDPGSAATSLLPQPVTAAAENILRLWSAAKAASHTLAVIDVSGSMAAPAGNGQSRIQLAATAASGALASFPDDSAFGLWAFSSSDTGGTPWTPLAPVTALGATSNGSTQREQLIAAAAKLPGLVTDGHTALYDTTLAAFQEIRNTYDPAKVNSVVLLTDGDNDYPSGITLDTLLAQLRLLVDSSRPVAIIAVGIGDQADIATLQQITAISGGKTYSVKNPADVPGVFLDAVLQRQCRPSC